MDWPSLSKKAKRKIKEIYWEKLGISHCIGGGVNDHQFEGRRNPSFPCSLAFPVQCYCNKTHFPQLLRLVSWFQPVLVTGQNIAQ